MSAAIPTDAPHLIANPIIVECEFATFRRGFVHAYVHLARRLFYWRDSNQWNKNFIRTLNAGKVADARRILAKMPYQPETVSRQGDAELSEANPYFWRVAIRGEDKSNIYAGNDPGDLFLKKIMTIIENVSGMTLYW